jgi:hypothetical protein
METIIIKAGDTSTEAAKLRQQYFSLRTKAFNAYWKASIYPDGPDEYDAWPDTTYVLHVENDKVIAGIRLLFHQPGSDSKVRSEIYHPEFDLRRLLPHLDVRNLSYCERSGLVADPDPAYQNRHLGTALLVDLFRRVKSAEITNSGAKIDLMFSSVSEAGLRPVIRASKQTGFHGMIRIDQIIVEQDPRFTTKLWPILSSPDPDFPFLPPALIGSNAGVKLEDFRLPARADGHRR